MNTAQQVKWFLQLKGKVQGPFNNENLVKALQGVDDESLTHALVWKRGLSEWIRANNWQSADKNIERNERSERNAVQQPKPRPTVSSATPPVSRPQEPKPKYTPTSEAVTNIAKTQIAQPDENTKTAIDNDLFEKTFAQAFTEGVFYRVQVNFVDQPLMSRNELMNLISKQADVSTISIQDPKTKDWKDVYSYPDIVEKLGLSRRKQQRVPILAQFNGKSNKNKNVSYRVITVSEGGMGFTENFDLKIGDEVEGQITSPHFFQPINVKADVIYAGLDGYIGLKFSQITDETKSAVIEYVKKFGKQSQKI